MPQSFDEYISSKYDVTPPSFDEFVEKKRGRKQDPQKFPMTPGMKILDFVAEKTGLGKLGRSAVGGFYSGADKTFGAMANAVDYLSEKTGLEKTDLFRKLSEEYAGYQTFLSEKGLPGIPGKFASGIGEAAFTIPTIMALPGGAATRGAGISSKVGGALTNRLAIHGGLMGGAEAIPGGLKEGLKGAALGGATGLLTHKILGGIGILPYNAKIPAYLGLGAVTTPGNIEDKTVGALTWAALGLSGGSKKISVNEFLKAYPKIRGKIYNKKSLHILKRMDSKLTTKEIEDAGGATAVLEDVFNVLRESARPQKTIKKGSYSESQIQPKEPLTEVMKRAPKRTRDELVYQLADRYYAVKQWVDAAKTISGKDISLENDPYWGMRAFGGREGQVLNAQEELRVIFEPVRKNKNDLMAYLQSYRNIERFNRGFKNPGGVTNVQAANELMDIRNRLGVEKYGELERTAQEFYSWADKNILQRLMDGKVLSKQGYKRIKAKSKRWLPFEVDEGIAKITEKFNIDNYKDGSDFFGVVQDALYGMKGTTKKIADPLDSVMKRLVLTVNLAEKNKILFNILKMRQTSGWAKQQIRKVTPKTRLPQEFGEFGIVINGKVQKWSAPKDVIRSLKQMTENETHFLDNIMRKSSTAFRAGTTGYYLPFTIFNIQRDLQMAAITAKYGFSPLDYGKGFMHALKSSYGWETGLYREYLQNHAGFGGLIQHEAGRFKREGTQYKGKDLFKSKGVRRVEEIANPAKFIKNVAQTFEMATRLGVYSKARKHASPFEAAMQSRGSTIDFYRAGQTMRLVNKWIPFINARAQAKVSLAESLGSKSGLREGKGRFMGAEGDPRAMAALRATTLITMPALVTYAYNRIYHNDVYEDLKDDYKDRYFPIILGTKEDEEGNKRYNIVPLAKGDLGTVIFNPIQNFLDYAFYKEPLKTKEMLLKVLNDLSPVEFEREGKFAPDRLLASVLPPVGRAGVTATTNKNLYWGKDVVPQSLARVEPEHQYNDYTSGFYKWIGKNIKASPMILQQFSRDLFGSILASPTPGGLLDSMKSRIVRDVGGKMTNDVYKYKEKADRGYYTARLRAKKAIEQGKYGESIAIIREWNQAMTPLMKELADIVQQPVGALMASPMYKSYTFSNEDIKRLHRDAQAGGMSSLEKQLGVKIGR